MNMNICLHVFPLHECWAPGEARKKHQMPWNWSYTWLCAGIWLLRIISGSIRAPITLNHYTTCPPASKIILGVY